MTSHIKGWLVERDGRSLFLRELVEWAIEDSEYTVTALVPLETPHPYEQFIEPSAQPSTDDTQERMQLMNELFDLMQQEIDQLKHRLEGFVEVVEGIVELTDVVSHSPIECRSKLIVIGDSCKVLLKLSE